MNRKGSAATCNATTPLEITVRPELSIGWRGKIAPRDSLETKSQATIEGGTIIVDDWTNDVTPNY